MEPEKLRRLVRNIRDLKYPRKSLQDVNSFEKILAKDLDTDTQEAMALLGYLLNNKYVRIIPDGLVMNPDSQELQDLVNSGALDREW